MKFPVKFLKKNLFILQGQVFVMYQLTAVVTELFLHDVLFCHFRPELPLTLFYMHHLESSMKCLQVNADIIYFFYHQMSGCIRKHALAKTKAQISCAVTAQLISPLFSQHG